MATVSTYGRNLRRLREAASLTQEELAQRMGLTRQGNLPSIESGLEVPEAPTILKHAEALGCLPSALLRGVRTVYDRIRDGEYDSDIDTRMNALKNEAEQDASAPRRPAKKRARMR